ncbi:unnamed protein product [Leptosia nina]|uniref:Uncharacterized protein n=1 Tax=Leptosia nina TaxID=320188 RepID=A0AAV1J6C4_9NEOP
MRPTPPLHRTAHPSDSLPTTPSLVTIHWNAGTVLRCLVIARTSVDMGIVGCGRVSADSIWQRRPGRRRWSSGASRRRRRRPDRVCNTNFGCMMGDLNIGNNPAQTLR